MGGSVTNVQFAEFQKRTGLIIPLQFLRRKPRDDDLARRSQPRILSAVALALHQVERKMATTTAYYSRPLRYLFDLSKPHAGVLFLTGAIAWCCVLKPTFFRI